MAEQRLVDANALALEPDEHNAMNGVRFVGGYRDGGRTIAMVKHALKQMIANAPTIDAAPVVHARWVHEQRYGDSGGWVWRCTACRREAISPIISALKYCHACGAKMDGGTEK